MSSSARHDAPLRTVRAPSRSTTVHWPGSAEGPDPWEDRLWSWLDTDDRYGPLWDAWELRKAGDLSDADFDAVADTLGLGAPATNDLTRPVWDQPPVHAHELMRIATDAWPHAGMSAMDLVLGPASLFADLALRRAALTGAAFLWTHGHRPNSFVRWCRNKPFPPIRDRARIRSVYLAPWALWHRDGDRLLDATGLAAVYQPDGPVALPDHVEDATAIAARVVRDTTGWRAHAVVPLPILPPSEPIRRWIRDELVLARTWDPDIPIEGVLRIRPTLVRRALRFGWISTLTPTVHRP